MNTKIKEFALKYLWPWPLIVGLVARLYKMISSSIWHDEGYTMWLLRFDYAGIIERAIRDVHPPGYYFLAKPWVTVFGDSIFSIRFFSLIFSLGIIYLVYKIITEVWGEKAAFWASLFVALSPFMVRFAQEARMYGVVAFFTTLATYFLVRMIKTKDVRWLWVYAPAMLLGFYTQYYAFFVVISHWIILSFYTKGFWRFNWVESFKQKSGVFGWPWWLANVLLLVGYAPWFPIAYKQVTRISGDYWIKPEWITARTIPGNVLHFMTYTHFDAVYYWNAFLGKSVYWLIVLLVMFGGLYIYKNKSNRRVASSLFVFGFLPMVLVFTVSKIASPIYQDRYFPFSAVAIFAIWGVLVSEVKNKSLKITLISVIVGTLLIGNYIMHKEVNHQMKALSDKVLEESQPEDAFLSGELYTFLDGSYYLGYGKLKFLSKPVDGFGESSLFYLEQDEYVVNPGQISQLPDRVWLIGKTGDKDYFSAEKWPGWDQETYFYEEKNNGLKAVLLTRTKAPLENQPVIN